MKWLVDYAGLGETLIKGGLAIVTGGTDTHLMLVDLRPKNVTGSDVEAALGRAHITCNKNGIPFDPQPPTVTSGVRLGTPAGTTRGFGTAEFREIVAGSQIIVHGRVLDVRPQWVDGRRRIESVVTVEGMQRGAERWRAAWLESERRTLQLDSAGMFRSNAKSLEMENDRLRRLLGLGARLDWGFIPAEALSTQGRTENVITTLALTAGSPPRPVAPDMRITLGFQYSF